MAVLWIVIALSLANLISATFFRRAWHRMRFVTPAEPWKFYSNVAGSIFVLAMAILMMTALDEEREVRLEIPASSK